MFGVGLAGIAPAATAVSSLLKDVGDFFTSTKSKNSQELTKAHAVFIKKHGENLPDVLDALTQIDIAQTKVNIAEINTKRRAGQWRADLGMYMSRAVILMTAGHYMINVVFHILERPPVPDPSIEVLVFLLTGMLGLSGLRTSEKFKKVAKDI